MTAAAGRTRSPRLRHVATGAWVAAVTVGGMATDRIHRCIYFDDGGPELLCVCGGRGMVLVEDEGSEALLVALLDDGDRGHEDVLSDEPAPVTLTYRRELAVSA